MKMTRNDIADLPAVIFVLLLYSLSPASGNWFSSKDAWETDPLTVRRNAIKKRPPLKAA
ncbi:hypothetical protein PSE_1061 [Pseudovibrio sp. FO-BEG1]|nr:hypothetical protein PSE_1061 [Pseudovibrio sp. FO-BEG1]